MYEDSHLEFMRHAKSQDHTFLKGRVAAEMKKTTLYMVDIELSSNGVILCAQCECAVGEGPGAHCKHVGVLLYAATQMKDGIKTRETCTQVLQTFHHAKRFKGSPMKMQALKLRNGSSLWAAANFDPRPPEMVGTPEFMWYFRNIWLGCGHSNLPIQQLYAPANIRAVCHDHDYLEETAERKMLNLLNVVTVSKETAAEIEEATRNQRSKRWHQEREVRIQSSDFGRVCKLTDRTDRKKLAESYTSRKTVRCDAMDHGIKFESTALREFEEQNRVSVAKSGIVVHPKYPFLGCSPDGVLESGALLEIKCPYKPCAQEGKRKVITTENVPYLVRNNEGKLQLDRSHQYYYQVQGQLMCTGRDKCFFFVWTPDDSVTELIERDDRFIQCMELKLLQFYCEYFMDALLNKHLYKNTDAFCFE